jgi:predicted DNA-binding transcriptional regulator AlpA
MYGQGFRPLTPTLERAQILDTASAASLCGFSVAHWRRLYRQGKVPQPVRLSARKLGWRTGDLLDWLGVLHA